MVLDTISYLCHLSFLLPYHPPPQTVFYSVTNVEIGNTSTLPPGLSSYVQFYPNTNSSFGGSAPTDYVYACTHTADSRTTSVSPFVTTSMYTSSG